MTTTRFENARAWWADLNPLVRLLILGLVIALLGIFTLKPAYRAMKKWRLEGNLKAAKVAVQEERMSEARDLSLSVLRAGDPRIDGFRVLEKSMASLRDPRHADIARALLSHPEGSETDRLTGFRGIVPEAPLGLLGQAWASLPEEYKKSPDFALLFADRLIQAEHLSEAASVLLAIPESDWTVAVKQQLAEVLIRGKGRQAYDEAQRRISLGWPTDPGAQAGWLDLLEIIPALSLTPNLLKPVSEDLSRPAQASIARNALMLARIHYAVPSADRAAVLERATTGWREKAPEELAKFLSQLGLHGILLETFPLQQFGENPQLLPYLREALVYLEQWPELTALLDQHGGPLPKSRLLMDRALVAAKSTDSASRAESWRAAMDDAKFSKAPDSYLALYDFARKAGMGDEAEQALTEAILRGRGPLPLYADIKPLLGSLSEKGRENVLMQICAIYLLFEPGNPMLLTHYAYLACLNDLAEPATILQAAEPLAKAFPDALPIQCLLAVTHLSAGKPAEAATALDSMKLDLQQIPPGFRAVILVTRALNGKIANDDPLIQQLPWQKMLPSERKKFSQWLNEIAHAPVSDSSVDSSPQQPIR